MERKHTWDRDRKSGGEPTSLLTTNLGWVTVQHGLNSASTFASLFKKFLALACFLCLLLKVFTLLMTKKYAPKSFLLKIWQSHSKF